MIAAAVGYFAGVSQRPIAAVVTGAILAMLCDIMMPEAFEHAHDFAGLIAVVGFLIAFVLTKLG